MTEDSAVHSAYSIQPLPLHPVRFWSRTTTGLIASLRDTFYVLSQTPRERRTTGRHEVREPPAPRPYRRTFCHHHPLTPSSPVRCFTSHYSTFSAQKTPDALTFLHPLLDPLASLFRRRPPIELPPESVSSIAVPIEAETPKEAIKRSKKMKKGIVTAKYIGLYRSITSLEENHAFPHLPTNSMPPEEVLRAHLSDPVAAREVKRRLHLWLANEQAVTPEIPLEVRRSLLQPKLKSYTAHKVRDIFHPLFDRHCQVNPAVWAWLSTESVRHFYRLVAATGETYYPLHVVRGLFAILQHRGEATAEEYHLLIRVFMRMKHLQDAIIALYHTKLHNVPWHRALQLDHWKLGQTLGLTTDRGFRRRLPAK